MSRAEVIVAAGATAILCSSTFIVTNAFSDQGGAFAAAHGGWLDVAKAALGTLFGAIVAFGSFVVQRWFQQRRENIIAGNLALFTLRAIQRRTVGLRNVVRYDIALKFSIYPDAPDWALVRPVTLSLAGDYSFDLGKLAFLLDSPTGRDAIKELKYAEDLFADLRVVFDLQQQCTAEMQEGTVALYRTKRDALWPEIADHLGPATVARAVSLFQGLLQRVEQNPSLHEVSFDVLLSELRSRFDDQAWDIEFPKESDPPPGAGRIELPTRLKDWLASLPK